MIQDIVADGLEEIWKAELGVVKIVKFDKACEDADLNSLPLHLIMFKVPRTPEIELLVKEILQDQLVFDIQGEPVIAIEMMSGSIFNPRQEIKCIPTLCLYSIPIFLDNYLVFQCWDPKCSYFFKVHLTKVENKIKYVFAQHIHWCVFPNLAEVFQIYPQNVVGQVKDSHVDLVNVVNWVWSMYGYTPFSQPLNVKAIVNDDQ